MQQLLDLTAALWLNVGDVEHGHCAHRLSTEQIALLEYLVKNDWDAGRLP